MGTDAHVIIVGGRRGALERACARIAQLEQRWSRFLPTSEVSELNRRAGTAVRVSADTALLVRAAVDAMRISGGSFDPTVLGAVVRAGYDRTFDELDGTAGTSALQLGCADIEVSGDVVYLPADTGFDPGGIGKGLAADLVVADAVADGVAGICVNLGGDVRVTGEPPTGDAWTVSVLHPSTDRPLVHLGLTAGAVATSTTLLRTWHVDGDRRHHIIDPATGRPSDTDLTLATVVSAQGWTSEILAKAVLLRGSRHPFDLLGGTACDALAVDERGRVHATPGITAFTGGAAVPSHLDDLREVLA